MVLGLRSLLVGAPRGSRSEGSGDSGGFSESGGQHRTEGETKEGRTRSFIGSFASRWHGGLGFAKSSPLPSAPRSFQTSRPLSSGWDQSQLLPSGNSHSHGPGDLGRKRPGPERG